MAVRFALLLPVLMALGPCGGPEPEIATGAAPVDDFSARQEACERSGGSFGRVTPRSELRVCFRTPRDANTRCDTNADCEGVCLARSRTCAPVVPLLGCNEVILVAGVVAVDCLD